MVTSEVLNADLRTGEKVGEKSNMARTVGECQYGGDQRCDKVERS